MSPFDGKWKRVSAENVDALVKEIAGGNAEKAGQLKAYLQSVELIEEYHVTDKDASRKIYVNGELKRNTTNPYGVEVDSETLLGKTKVLLTKKSDNLIEATETAGSGPKSKVVFAVEGNKLKLDYTINNVTCTRIYERC